MGILDKVMFWKKDDDFLEDTGQSDPFASPDPMAQTMDPLADRPDPMASSFDPLAHEDPMSTNPREQFSDPMSSGFADDPTLSAGRQPQGLGRSPAGQPMQMQQQVVQPVYDEGPSRDVELILAKLDAIKAELDSVHQRVRKLEAHADKQPPEAGQKYAW